jgi:hypothetical protein
MDDHGAALTYGDEPYPPEMDDEEAKRPTAAPSRRT